MPAGHAYALNIGNTGGRGSAMHPFSGQNSSLAGSFTINFAFCGLIVAGGSGGGFDTAGVAGAVTPPVGIIINPSGPSVAGLPFNLFPYPPAIAPPSASAASSPAA